MTVEQNSNNIPKWLIRYRDSFDRKRIIQEASQNLFLSVEASQKYDQNRQPRNYYGVSLVYFLPPDSETFSNLTDISQTFKDLLEERSLSEKLALLPNQTFHITLYDIETLFKPETETKIIDSIESTFSNIDNDKLSKLNIGINGNLLISDGASVIAPIEPMDEETISSIFSIRNSVSKNLLSLGDEIVHKNPNFYAGHVTLAYIVNDLSYDEYPKLKRAVNTASKDEILGKTEINTIELRHFNTMESWNKPLLTHNL